MSVSSNFKVLYSKDTIRYLGQKLATVMGSCIRSTSTDQLQPSVLVRRLCCISVGYRLI